MRVLANMTVDAAQPSLLVTNLTDGVTYKVTVSAATRAGIGPPSDPMPLRLDTTSRVLLNDHTTRFRPDLRAGSSGVTESTENSTANTHGEFFTETWFIALLGSMFAVMVILFLAMAFVRRRQLMSKKTTLTSINGKNLLLYQ